MKNKWKELALVICVSYTILSMVAAIVNTIAGTQTSNANAIMMLILTTISVSVLYLSQLLDRFSPLFTITLQYLVALMLAGIALFIWNLFDEISGNGYLDFFVSFTVFYAIGAVIFYVMTYLETKKMNELLQDIQADKQHKH